MVKIDRNRLVEMVSQDEMAGFCLACGEEAYNVEPDARGYTCEHCGKKKVFGAEELLIKAGGF
jgi:hypothetical protein